MNDTAKHLIFIIDDDDAVRASTRALLEAQGYAVRDFFSAEQFLETARGHSADCLVLDVNLSGMSGVELIEQLRAQGVQTPVIIVSANGKQTMARATRAGVAAILRKPMAADALLHWLEQIFSKAP